MALFYHSEKLRKNPPHLVLDIQSLDYQGLGVAKLDGKTWFVENALPQEKVKARVIEDKRQYGHAVCEKILQKSPSRQISKCQYFQQCGGCQTQHIPIEMQREAKQQALFQRLQKLQTEQIDFQQMIVGEPWHYRRRLRLSLKFNPKNKQLDIGFRQKGQSEIVNIQHCEVIEPKLNNLLLPLRDLLNQFSKPKILGHIELTAADNGVAMLLRHQQNLPETDRTLLINFAEQYQLMLFVQDDEKMSHLYGELPEYEIMGLKLQFDIRDFIQVNRNLNLEMVETALDWLDLKVEDFVLDLFCGMGNFTLPIAQKAKRAVGIEGVFAMVEKARKNAERNNCANVEFQQGDLDKTFVEQDWVKYPFNKILLDPPRSGAAFAIGAISQLQAEKILYVSCNPATLIRDAEMLLNSGYQLKKVAMIDMFPQTGHLESISLFEKK